MWVYAALAAFQVASGFQQAQMIRENADLQNRVNDFNAAFAELDAYQAERQGFTDVSRYQTVVDKTLSDQRSAYAAQGVDVNYGTAAEVQAETRLTGILNMFDLQRQAREKAMGFKTEAINIRLQGGMRRLQSDLDASGVQRQAVIGAVSTGISGYTRK